MKQFFKYTLATVAGLFVMGMILALIGFISFVSSIASGESKPSVKDKTVLHLSLNGTLNERTQDNPFAEIMGNDALSTQGLDNILKAIKVAKENKKISGIYLECGSLSTDYASLEEIHHALKDFKQSGKFILSYADTYTQGCYYLASTADKLLINPQGALDWHGIASQPVFYTDLMKKVGVKAQVFKVGTYKSAVEPFILTSMSDANREQVSSFVGDIWKTICTDVASARHLSYDTLNVYADRYLTLSDPAEYVKLGLVDSLAYSDGVRDCLRSMAKTEKVNLIETNELALLDDSESKSDDKIAVYYAEGNIVAEASTTSPLSGSTPEIVGSQVVKDLDELANDDDVKAVVLRINSGGGSAYASEQMWRAVQLLKAKKPVVVSMGGMAASGGYYMASGADYIFAEPTTLTGSIGIFGLIPDMSELLTEKLGLHFDVVKTNESSDFGAPGRPFNQNEGDAIQSAINRGYQLFLSRVGTSRKMKVEDVDKIAQGRVWTGNQALSIKLVDKLGTLNDAIAEAARRAKMKEYALASYPAPASWMDNLLSSAKEDDYLEQKLQTVLGVYYQPLSFFANLNRSDYMQARIFYLPNLN